MDGVLSLVPTEWSALLALRWQDALDVILMTFLIYQGYVLFRGTRAARIGVGLALLGVGYLIAQTAGLLLTSWVLGGIWAVVFILVIVVFQTEIRQILEHVNPRLPSLPELRQTAWAKDAPDALATLADTCFTLANKRCGALLIFERRDPLEPLLRSPGILIEARISAPLVENLFTPPTPLHDGALYLRRGRIYRAGTVLPLSETASLPHFYGTRHRAAIGITERSDALAVVVSEERGTVSVVEHGGMSTMPTVGELCDWLTTHLVGAPKKRWVFWPSPALLTYNWRAKLGSFAAVMLLWIVFVGPQNTEIGFSVPVVYHNIPADLELDGKRSQEVYLRLRGSRELLRFLDPRRLQAQVNLKDATEGSSRYSLSTQEVNVPLGVQVAGVDPATVTVRLKKKPPPETPADAGGTVKSDPQKKKEKG